MSDDLVARLRHAWDERERQLDEDEQVATDRGKLAGDTWGAVEVSAGRWEVVGAGGRGLIADHLPQHEADHIARHDPARVLAEVERGRRDIAAKRRILDAIFRYEARIDGEWGCIHNAAQIEAGECPDTRPDEIAGVRLLAEAEGLA